MAEDSTDAKNPSCEHETITMGTMKERITESIIRETKEHFVVSEESAGEIKVTSDHVETQDFMDGSECAVTNLAFKVPGLNNDPFNKWIINMRTQHGSNKPLDPQRPLITLFQQFRSAKRAEIPKLTECVRKFVENLATEAPAISQRMVDGWRPFLLSESPKSKDPTYRDEKIERVVTHYLETYDSRRKNDQARFEVEKAVRIPTILESKAEEETAAIAACATNFTFEGADFEDEDEAETGTGVGAGGGGEGGADGEADGGADGGVEDETEGEAETKSSLEEGFDDVRIYSQDELLQAAMKEAEKEMRDEGILPPLPGQKVEDCGADLTQFKITHKDVAAGRTRAAVPGVDTRTPTMLSTGKTHAAIIVILDRTGDEDVEHVLVLCEAFEKEEDFIPYDEANCHAYKRFDMFCVPMATRIDPVELVLSKPVHRRFRSAAIQKVFDQGKEIAAGNEENQQKLKMKARRMLLEKMRQEEELARVELTQAERKPTQTTKPAE